MRGLSDAIGILEDHLHREQVVEPLASRQRRAPAAPRTGPRRRRRDGCPATMRAERRLAAAGLADQAEDLAALDREIDALDRVHDCGGSAPTDAMRIRSASVGRRAKCLLAPRTSRMRRASSRGSRARADGGSDSAGPPRLRPADRPRGRRPSRAGSAGGRRNRRPRVEGAAPCRGSARRRAPRAASSRNRVEQAARVGMARARRARRPTRPGLDDAAGIHHGDPVGELGHDGEVVRDPDQRRAASRARASASRRGSGPGSSRRAPWSARRR